MCGEVGLSGEIRPVNRIEQRILEAEKLGFKKTVGGKGVNILPAADEAAGLLLRQA